MFHMVRRIRFVGLLLAVIIVTTAATKAYTAPTEPQTQIVTDQKTGAIRFIVKGQEEARARVHTPVSGS
jgi:general stress protein CsbA